MNATPLRSGETVPLDHAVKRPAAVMLQDVSIGFLTPDRPGESRATPGTGSVSFATPQGGFHLISGPGGSGKSALMSLIALNRQPTAGRLALFGQDTAAVGRPGRIELRRRIGQVLDDRSFLADASLLDSVLLPLEAVRTSSMPRLLHKGRRTHSGPQRRAVSDARELLHWVGLGGREDDPADSLSTGESRRLDLARALIRRPDLLIIDDPTGGLDESGAWRIMGLIEQLHRQGTTVIVATNDRLLLDSLPHPRTILPAARRGAAARSLPNSA